MLYRSASWGRSVSSRRAHSSECRNIDRLHVLELCCFAISIGRKRATRIQRMRACCDKLIYTTVRRIGIPTNSVVRLPGTPEGLIGYSRYYPEKWLSNLCYSGGDQSGRVVYRNALNLKSS